MGSCVEPAMQVINNSHGVQRGSTFDEELEEIDAAKVRVALFVSTAAQTSSSLAHGGSVGDIRRE